MCVVTIYEAGRTSALSHQPEMVGKNPYGNHHQADGHYNPMGSGEFAKNLFSIVLGRAAKEKIEYLGLEKQHKHKHRPYQEHNCRAGTGPGKQDIPAPLELQEQGARYPHYDDAYLCNPRKPPLRALKKHHLLHRVFHPHNHGKHYGRYEHHTANPYDDCGDMYC
jgi:hypothetical protein